MKRAPIEVFLKGKKMWGPYAFIKTSGLSSKDSWILLRMKKDEALFKKPKNRTLRRAPSLRQKATAGRQGERVRKDVSALTGRTMKQNRERS